MDLMPFSLLPIQAVHFQDYFVTLQNLYPSSTTFKIISASIK